MTGTMKVGRNTVLEKLTRGLVASSNFDANAIRAESTYAADTDVDPTRATIIVNFSSNH